MRRTVACLLLAAFACGAHAEPANLKATVTQLVDATTKNSTSEAKAFTDLLALGTAGVPYIISHLNDGRPLAEQSLVLQPIPGSHETRQYKPWFVHDGLVILLTEMTGIRIGDENRHTAPAQRAQNKRKWIRWCEERYPDRAAACSGE